MISVGVLMMHIGNFMETHDGVEIDFSIGAIKEDVLGKLRMTYHDDIEINHYLTVDDIDSLESVFEKMLKQCIEFERDEKNVGYRPMRI